MKTLTALVLSGALALGACKPVKRESRVSMPEAETTHVVFRADYFDNYNGPRGTTVPGVVMGIDTDGDPRTIEEALVVRGHYGVMAPLPNELEVKPRKEWQHLLAPGASAKRYVTDNTATMTPRQQIMFNEIAQLTGYRSNL